MKQCKDCCAENGIELPKMRGKYHGGQRDNAGRKRKWDEATVTCAFRIPASRKAELEKLVSDWMESIKPS